ncbi:MAG TPA: hypothetical protein VKA16_12695, partial [Burkholderiales bacterium]|nr:hypothetical protein [Burkholderiales bacterium]
RQGLRALAKQKEIDPEPVERYLFTKFGEGFDDALGAMQALAKSRTPAKLAGEAYRLYEAFRPSVPAGTRGWGAKGELVLSQIRRLASSSK